MHLTALEAEKYKESVNWLNDNSSGFVEGQLFSGLLSKQRHTTSFMSHKDANPIHSW